MSRETKIDGVLNEIRFTATWLRDSMSIHASTLADTTYTQRSRVPSAWTSDASSSFVAELGHLGDAADGTASGAADMADEVDALAAALETAQSEMERARATARSGGLDVDGTIIRDAGNPPPDVPGLAADASPLEKAQYDQGVAAIEEYDAKVAAWNAAIAIADDADADWHKAVERLATTWSSKGSDILALLNDLFTGFAGAAVQFRVSKWFAESAGTYHQQAGVYRLRAASYLTDGYIAPGERSAYYDSLDRAAKQDLLADGSKFAESKVALRVSRGLLALGVVATGVGIYTDIQDGESPAQAAVSNGGAFLAATGTGALIGAGVGSFIPIPIVGTAVGAVAGTIIGAGVGIVTSGMIDSMWENGVDNIGDVGEALSDGVDELVDTGEAIGDLASDAKDAVTGGVKDAWGSVFG